MVVGFITTCATVYITTKVVSSNPVQGEVYSIQYYVIKFVSNLQQVGSFLQVLRFLPNNRKSSRNLGILGIVVLAMPMLLVVTNDLLTALKHI
jgi:hypothetical protein